MKIFITGGTGFVGTYLVKQLIANGHNVTILTDPILDKGFDLNIDGVDYIEGNPTIKGEWQNSVPKHDVIINLAGASIFTRWTKERKEIIQSSRINTTGNLVEALPENSKHITLISTSAVGYYGFTENEKLTESSPAGDDFLAQTSYKWEQEALRAKNKAARVIITRFGIVLGKNGGALGMMIPLFKYFIGGPLGSGRQWFSWIHIQDLAAAFLFLIEKNDLSGSFNFCSPNPVKNKELARAIGEILHRPLFFPAPGFVIKILLGEFGSVLLKGQRVVPEKLLANGFHFNYPEIKNALKDII